MNVGSHLTKLATAGVKRAPAPETTSTRRAAGVRLEGVTKRFGRKGRTVTALDDVTLSVEAGEIFGIIGRSGAGKSTLLRCLTALEQPTSGSIRIGGTDLTGLSGSALRAVRRDIGIVFQQFNLLDSRDVRGNIAFPLEVAGVPTAERRRRVEELIELVGLTDRAHAHPAELSGGQKQRVGIARALASEPRLLLCDEATSALDSETTTQILDLIREVNDRLGVTVILITHELDVIRRICDSAALIEDGRIVDHGALADLLADPSSPLGEAILPITASQGDTPSVLVTVTGEQARSPFLSQLSRDLDVDVTILAGGVEEIAGDELARLRIGWAGRSGDVDAARVVAALTSLGASAVAA